jgi:16S rRNA (guanine966-N2)-methyltransferase
VTRVVAGSARGRRLAVPPGTETRPTSDRAREALFSTVESLLGPLHGSRVLDLYAGSGAVGIEALSRGAAHALLVEADARAARTAQDNVTLTGLPGAVVSRERVERVAAGAAPGSPYDLVFADPPYRLSDAALRDVLTALMYGGWLRDGALLVVERATRGGEWTWPDGVEAERSRRYGEATLWYGRAASRRGAEAGPAADQPAGPTEE